MRSRGGRARRVGAGAVAGLAVVLTLSSCADKNEPVTQPAPAPATSGTAPAATASAATPGATPSPSATTAALPGMPQPRSVEDSPVDSTQIRSASDLSTAFKCQAGVAPIQIPATAATAAATDAPAVAARPAVVVCASALADREALFLYYAPTPQAKLAALQDAYARAPYVHGGPNWVAAGTIDPQLGTVGGEIYR